MLMMGEMPVASAAPVIPIPMGNMKIKSKRILKIPLTSVAVITRLGA